MIESALEISPDLTANIGPALAEGKVLAEIGAISGIDHAFEQRKPVAAAGESVMRMFAEELQRRIGCAHLLENVTPDHQESSSGIADAREAVDARDVIGILQFEHIVERARRNIWPLVFDHPPGLFPIDPLD